MRFRPNLSLLLYGFSGVVLVLAVLVAVRVHLSTRYSMPTSAADESGESMASTWGQLERWLREREQPQLAALARDPLWPVYVQKPSEAAVDPAVAATTLNSSPRGTPARLAPVRPAARPRPILPRVAAVLLDREARALLQIDGRTRSVRVGDRFGEVEVLEIGSAGVTVAHAGGRTLLPVR